MTGAGNALKSLVLVLVALACLLGGDQSARAAATNYTSAYAGGTINPGDTVALDDGATITGAITNNGRLQFNQTSGTLTMSSALAGSGTLSLTNAGTLMLTGTTVSVGIGLDMTTTVDSGRLLIGNNGGRTLYLGNTNGGVGTLLINGGYVGNGSSYLGFAAGGQASVTVSSGSWSNGIFTYVGWDGSATLDVTGGSVSGVTASIGRNAGSVGSVTVSGGTMSYSSNLTRHPHALRQQFLHRRDCG
jgi:fibronectin-binding autotransporter adhesin